MAPLRFQGDLSGVEGSPESVPDVSGSDTVKMLNSERKLLFFQPGGERRTIDGKNASRGQVSVKHEVLFSAGIWEANRQFLEDTVGALIGFTGRASPRHDSSTGTGAFLPKDAASEGNLQQDCKRQRAGAWVVILKTRWCFREKHERIFQHFQSL